MQLFEYSWKFVMIKVMYDQLFQLQEEVLKTIANKKRLEILQLLGTRELTVNEMVAMLGISQANVSQHLAVLRRVKVVTAHKEGMHVYYRVAGTRIIEIITTLRTFLRQQYGDNTSIAYLNELENSVSYPIVKDPVCGMRFGVGDASCSLPSGDGHYVYFCGPGCRDTFKSSLVV